MKKSKRKTKQSQNFLNKHHQGILVGILVLIIVFLILAAYGIMEISQRRAHASAEMLVSDVVNHIDSKMNEVEETTLKAAESVYSLIKDPDALEKYIHEFVASNNFIYGSTIAFEPGFFLGRSKGFAPYSWRSFDGEVHDRLLGEETDYFSEEWYSETKRLGKAYWCEPYYDEGGAKIMMSTFSVPIKDENGNLIAVMTGDVGLVDLGFYLSSIKPYKDSYIVLLSKKGETLANSQYYLASGRTDSVIIRGVTKLGWSVELSIPFSYLIHGDVGILFVIVSILAVTVLFVLFINRMLSRVRQRSAADHLSVINSLSSSYSSIFLLNLMTDESLVYRDPAKYKHVLNNSKLETREFRPMIMTLLQFDCYSHDLGKMMYETTSEAIRSNLSSQERYEVRFRKESHGEIIWYEMDVFTLERNESGEPVRAVVAFEDVNDSVLKEKEAQVTLEKALSDAQSANNAKTTFLFNMSHDIRTPMNAILGYTDMALRHIDEKEVSTDCLQKIKMSGGHLLNLINDILEMSRIEAGKLELLSEPLDIRDIIANTEYMSRVLAVPKSIDFEFNVGEIRTPYVYFDELHLNEVLINIISNAMKYSREDGTVIYNVTQKDGTPEGQATFRFEVADNGIGMSEEFLEHIFEAFSREKSTTISKMEGAGLGLSIVKRIVDMAGGTIDIKSRQGEGTTVTIEFTVPVMNDADIEAFVRKHEAASNPSADIVLEGKKVLLVEDNEMNREIAEEILTDAGLVIETAEDGDVAVRAVSEKGASYYDFILMDIQMPVMNGYEATKAIRELPDGHRVPVIAVSANAFEEDKQKSLEAGMNAHIAKPIDISALFEAMQSLV